MRTRPFNYESSKSYATFDQTEVFKFAICALDRIWINSDLTDHLAQGRQLVALPKVAPLKCANYLVHQLPKGRSIRARVESKDNCWFLVVHALVH